VKVLTVDVEDWFHLLEHPLTDDVASWDSFERRVEPATERILDELNRRGIRATFFCLGWIAERYPGIVRKIAEGGHEIGSHSYAHQLVHRQDRQAFAADLARSIALLADVTGAPVRAYRAPGFSITRDCLWAFEIMAGQGIEIDCSVFPSPRAHGGLEGFCAEPAVIRTPGGALKELPMTMGRIMGRPLAFSGGGYFRLLPRAVIDHQMAAQGYTMTYFHPRDFDAGQPVLPGLSPARRFKSYVGLRGAWAKFLRMLDAFSFVSVGEAAASIDWDKARTVDLA
jgi:polysaccharide deacetylase family protein (PEP-CTERM system associated)